MNASSEAVVPVGGVVGMVCKSFEELFPTPDGAEVFTRGDARFVRVNGHEGQVWPIPESLDTARAFSEWAEGVFHWFSDAEHAEVLLQYEALVARERAEARCQERRSKDPATPFFDAWARLAKEHNEARTDRAIAVDALADICVIYLAGFPSRSMTVQVSKAIRTHGYATVREAIADLLREKAAPADAIRFLNHRCQQLKEAAHA